MGGAVTAASAKSLQPTGTGTGTGGGGGGRQSSAAVVVLVLLLVLLAAVMMCMCMPKGGRCRKARRQVLETLLWKLGAMRFEALHEDRMDEAASEMVGLTPS